jgi:hypothetical protein
LSPESIVVYHDEDRLDSGLVAAFRRNGIDLVTAFESGMAGRTDEEHLVFAAGRSMVLYSANVRDFARLHFEWIDSGRTHAGIVLCPSHKWSIGDQLRTMLRLRAELSAQQMVNRLEYLSGFLGGEGG